MRRSLIFFTLAFVSLVLTASCDTVTAAVPLGKKCHNRDDGSVLKTVEDANGKQWRVVGEYPPLQILGRTFLEEGVCAVSVGAGQAMFGKSIMDGGNGQYWLHPETGEHIEGGAFGPQKGLLDIDAVEYEWY